MNFYIDQKPFSLRERFYVYTADQEVAYYVEGPVFSLARKFYVYDKDGNEKAYIHQKPFSLKYRFYVSVNGTDIMEIVKDFGFRPKYHIKGLDWSIEGGLMGHNYAILSHDEAGNEIGIAYISKKWVSWMDSYEINIANGANEDTQFLIICLAIIIDGVLANETAAAASGS